MRMKVPFYYQSLDLLQKRLLGFWASVPHAAYALIKTPTQVPQAACLRLGTKLAGGRDFQKNGLDAQLASESTQFY